MSHIVQHPRPWSEFAVAWQSFQTSAALVKQKKKCYPSFMDWARSTRGVIENIQGHKLWSPGLSQLQPLETLGYLPVFKSDITVKMHNHNSHVCPFFLLRQAASSAWSSWQLNCGIYLKEEIQYFAGSIKKKQRQAPHKMDVGHIDLLRWVGLKEPKSRSSLTVGLDIP